MRDGRSERRSTEPTLEGARRVVASFFEFDFEDRIEGAWIFEEVVL